ncbi:MAG: HINT domain-containing protein [Planctomycetaceae bacterium]|jgi:hypothetical protein|nr:HINT domain-containing protein [Planctomycetaceae bacterium]
MPKRFEHQQSKTQPMSVFHFNTWITSGLIVCLLISGYLWDNYISSKTIVTTTTKVISVPKASNQDSSSTKFAKIHDVQVGERAIGTNPEVTDSERSTFLPDPNPVTWRKLTLEMIKSDGKRLDIILLRPLNWISESQADIGTTIFLDLPELGAQGFAKVLNIEPCPSIKRGKGNVITGTFHHEAANTIDLHVEGLSKSIGCTDNHPFWSVTRNEFVEAGKLQLGEELHLYSGQTAKVIQILPRPGVHNLEVMNEHVYRVTGIGLLVHNACAIGIEPVNGATGHHIFPKQAFTNFTGDYSSGYHPNKAFVVPHAEIMKQGFNHPQMTGKQTSLYKQLAQEEKKPTFADHQRITKEALIARGVDSKDASAIVFAVSAQVKGEGWEFITHL